MYVYTWLHLVAKHAECWIPLSRFLDRIPSEGEGGDCDS